MSLRSILQKRAPFLASDITLLKSIFVSSMSAAGDPESDSYGSLSPPTTILTLHGSLFNGQWSQAKLAYVTFLSVGTCWNGIKSIVSVLSTPL